MVRKFGQIIRLPNHVIQ